MARYTNGSIHKFFCMKCGQESIPIFRKAGKQKEKMHRKRMYCFHCKEEINHIEVRNWQEEAEFKKAFASGSYVQEVEESLAHVNTEKGRYSWICM